MGIFTRERDKADFLRGRIPMEDATFARACGVTGDALGERVAVGVRRVIARLGKVAPEWLYPTDRWPEDIGFLPFWDSIDLLEFLFQIEDEFSVAVPAAGFALEFPRLSLRRRRPHRYGFNVRQIVWRVWRVLEEGIESGDPHRQLGAMPGKHS